MLAGNSKRQAAPSCVGDGRREELARKVAKRAFWLLGLHAFVSRPLLIVRRRRISSKRISPLKAFRRQIRRLSGHTSPRSRGRVSAHRSAPRGRSSFGRFFPAGLPIKEITSSAPSIRAKVSRLRVWAGHVKEVPAFPTCEVWLRGAKIATDAPARILSTKIPDGRAATCLCAEAVSPLARRRKRSRAAAQGRFGEGFCMSGSRPDIAAKAHCRLSSNGIRTALKREEDGLGGVLSAPHVLSRIIGLTRLRKGGQVF